MVADSSPEEWGSSGKDAEEEAQEEEEEARAKVVDVCRGTARETPPRARCERTTAVAVPLPLPLPPRLKTRRVEEVEAVIFFVFLPRRAEGPSPGRTSTPAAESSDPHGIFLYVAFPTLRRQRRNV